uniref:G_PROTEIN_RECEP_F1_2 domain-containing protein n=1 Tax=Caenorhabditis tropicalis TaxID=1561998 RepID=A0A1I7V2G2_9PELO
MSLYAPEDFEGFSESSKTTWVPIANSILHIAIDLTEFQCVIAFIGVIANLFHLIVLSRKSIPKTSVNVIMIGIGVCDLFNMGFNGYDTLVALVETSDKCRPPASYLWKVIGFWASALEDHSRRLSSLFGVLMASTRYLVIRNALNPKFDIFSKPKFALITMLIAFLFSTFLTLYFWSRYRFVEVKPWNPPIECQGFPIGYTAPQYKSSLEDIYLIELTLGLQIFSVVDGLFKIIPTIMFPILTFLLVKELKKAASSRKRMSTETKEEHSKTDQTTKLVALMAIFYIIAEGPIGILFVIQGIITKPFGIVEMTVNLIDIFGTFFSMNAIMHCVICLAVSSQYQKAAKQTFCFGRWSKRTSPLSKPSVSTDPTARKATVKNET